MFRTAVAALAAPLLAVVLSGCGPYVVAPIRREPLSPAPSRASSVEIVDVALGDVGCLDCARTRNLAIAGAMRGIQRLPGTLNPRAACEGDCLRLEGNRVCVAKRVLDGAPADRPAFRIGIVVESHRSPHGNDRGTPSSIARDLILGGTPVRTTLHIAAWNAEGQELDQERIEFDQSKDSEDNYRAWILMWPGFPTYPFDQMDSSSDTVEERSSDVGYQLGQVLERTSRRFVLQFSNEPTADGRTIPFIVDDQAKAGLRFAERKAWREALAEWERIPQKSTTVLYDMALVHGVLGEDEQAWALLEKTVGYDSRFLVRTALKAARARHAFRSRPRLSACTF